MALYNNGADVPSPQEASNGFPQPGASGTWHKGEEEVRLVEPSMVKKAHREILDHERKRRVELKCMELQEMMEEQGVIENHHGVDGEEYAVEYPDYGEGCVLQCDCSAECYREDSGHREYRLKRRSSSSTSPPPKKKKKKKSGHRRSRKKRKPGSERSCDSSSPIRKEKKKKTGKKHRRDRSESGSRKKRRHRSRSPKNKRKEKNKERKRSRSESPAWRSHRRSSCSSHSASLSSDDSGSKSPGRLSPKRRQDGPKGSSARSSRSPSSPSPQRSASPHQNGHKGSAQNGRHSHGAPLPEPSDVRRLFLDHSSLPSPPPSTGLPPCSPLPSFPTRSAPRPAQPEHTGEMWGAGCTLPALTTPALGARSPWGSQPIALRQGSGQPTGHPSLKATCCTVDPSTPQQHPAPCPPLGAPLCFLLSCGFGWGVGGFGCRGAAPRRPARPALPLPTPASPRPPSSLGSPAPAGLFSNNFLSFSLSLSLSLSLFFLSLRPASASPSPRAHGRTEPPSPRTRGSRHGGRSPRSPTPERAKHGHRHRSRSASPPSRHRGQSKGRPPAPREPQPPPLSPAGYSSDSEGSAGSHPYHPPAGPDRNHGAHGKKVKERHHRGRPNSSSESSAKHSRHASERRKSPSRSPGQRSSSWSSSGSLSKSRSRSREKRAGRSRSRSPSPKKPASREKDNEPRTRHGDPDPARPRRRSRSYSPIRKRRRDSPSFMEPRRITSARKRPIPYYRPSPSSSSSLSTYSPPGTRPQPPDSPALPPPCHLRPQKGRDHRGGGKEPGDAKDGPGSGGKHGRELTWVLGTPWEGMPPSPPSPHGKLRLAPDPQPCWDLGESPENTRTQASSGGFPQWPQPQPCSPRGAAAPKNPRPDCSGAADQPAHQGKIPVFLFYSLCLLPRREPTGTNTL
ncbi:hypothetical protein Nmel_016578 [Mimus melanotis]